MLNNENRRKFEIRLNDIEKALVKEKAKQYGYESVGAYLRDVGVYESLYIEDVVGKEEIYDSVNNLLLEITRYNNNIQKLLNKNITFQTEEIRKNVSEELLTINREIKGLKKIINDKLSVTKEYASVDKRIKLKKGEDEKCQ